MATRALSARQAEQKALDAIEERGILLVYPIDNRPEPASLWSELYPRSEMRWEWDSGGDDRVAKLWGLRADLSQSGKVIYSKWYQGRATFFSKECFTALLVVMGSQDDPRHVLSFQAQALLEVLEMDSPLSTKQLKRAAELQGKANEARYARALKELFTRLWAVGFGEVDDGAFPSLAVGASRVLFEELWNRAQKMSLKEANALLDRRIPKESLFRKFWERQLQLRSRAQASPRGPR